MPSFSENIKYFAILLDGTFHRFEVSKQDLRAIQALINRTIVSQGPEAIRSVKNRAIRDTLLGVLSVVVGVALTLGSYMAAAKKPEGGTYIINYGLILFGLVALGKGIYGFMNYRALRRLSRP